MLDRCPGCSKEVSEADDICPHCKRDFTAPILRRPPQRQEPPLKEIQKKPFSTLPRASLDETQLSPPAWVDESQLRSAPQSKNSLSTGPQTDPYMMQKPPEKPLWPFIIGALACSGALIYSRATPPPLPKVVVADAVKPPPTASISPAEGQTPVTEAPSPDPAPEITEPAAASALPPATLTEAARRKPKPQRPQKSGRRNSQRNASMEMPAPLAQSPGPEPIDRDSFPNMEINAPQGSQSNEFRIQGTVFVLISLAPVEDADITFTNLSTGRRFSTATGPTGEYRAHLPVSERGYNLSIRHPKHEPSYVEDEERNFRTLSGEQRSEIAASRARTLSNVGLLTAEGGRVLTRDFALIPRMR